jgi:hypothetical protein
MTTYSQTQFPTEFWRRNLRNNIVRFTHNDHDVYNWLAKVVEQRPDLANTLHDLIQKEFSQYLPKFQQILLLQ